MEDLNFTHNVPQIPAQEQLPETPKASVNAEVISTPDYQSAVNNYASATNWMSNVGSLVASKASNQIASQMGTSLGKNPQGDLSIPITDFDKTMQESYKAQAQSTLGLQAHQLITDSNLKLASVPRLTPDLIQSTNKSVSLGLQNIFKNAPNEIRPEMEYRYGTQQMNQTADLTERMIRENKEDQRNTTNFASVNNAQNAYSFGMKGDEKAGLATIAATEKANQAAVAARLITPEEAKTNVDTARKSYLNGKYVNGYEQARAQGKGEEYLKNLADHKPSDLSDADYIPVTSHVMEYVNHQDAMRAQDEKLRLSKFYSNIQKDPSSITSADWAVLQANVNPLEFENMQHRYIKAVKANQAAQLNYINTLQNWTNPTGFATLPEKQVNMGFNNLVKGRMEQAQQTGNPITQDQAEVEVAAAAGGKIPFFTNAIKNKLHSADPAQMDSAAQQIDQLYSMNAGHALIGLNDQDKALNTQYKSLRDSIPAVEAAKIAIQNANQDPDTQRMNKEKWAAFLKKNTGGVFQSTSPSDFALNAVSLNKNDFMNPGLANVYGNMILQKYSTYYQMLNGDQQNALKLTQQAVKENYGYTGVNGGSSLTLHPIEKVLGYEGNNDIVPYIQKDVINNLNQRFAPVKQQFDEHKVNEFWEVVPSSFENKAMVYGSNYNPIQVKKYIRSGNAVKSQTYNVVLMGNPYNWDVGVQDSTGVRPMMQIAPYLHVATYTPNIQQIQRDYSIEQFKHSHPVNRNISTQDVMRNIKLNNPV